jgi:septal ring factor EnvC (AmiA/AmiB activator)
MNRTHTVRASVSRLLLVGGTAALTALASCSDPKITKEQLDQIRELRKQQSTLGEKIKTSQGELARLETEIADRQKAVDKCNEEKTGVQDRLNKMPNPWPDYTPPPPADSTAKSIKKTK